MTQTTRSLRPATRVIAWMGSWLLAGLAWIPTLGQAQGMSSTPGPSTLGTMGMPPGAFLGFWTVMMAAMMLPTLAPRLALHLEMARPETRGLLLAVRAGGLVLGYLLVWAACGLPIYGLAGGEAILIRTAPSGALEGRAIVLVAVGLSQLTPLQARCLAACRRPLDRQSPLQALPAAWHDVATGVAHGLDCLGTCGGLMLLLVIVGLMNLPWMLVIALIVGLEKGWRYGHQLAMVVGIGLLLFGIMVAGDPGLLPGSPPGVLP